jgi:hypothetical protein
MEDLENAARSSGAKGFDHDKKGQVVESSETQIKITPADTDHLSFKLSQRIAKKLEAWGVESRGAIISRCSSFLKPWSVFNRRAFFFLPPAG